MKSIYSAQKDSILSLYCSGLSSHQTASKTGLGKSTVAHFLKSIYPDKENQKGGCPSKLSPPDKRAVVNHIVSGKADNAIQATHFINSIITNPVSSQTWLVVGQCFVWQI